MKPCERSNATGSDRPAHRNPRRAIRCAALLVGAWSCCAPGAAADPIRTTSILTVAESVEAPAPEAGLLRDLAVREGDSIRGGFVLASVDPREQEFLAELARRELHAARHESQSDLSVRLAEAENRVARAELQRATSVNAELPNTVSDKEVDRLRLAAERTALQIDHSRFERELLGLKIRRIEADLRLAEHRVERLAIRSPIAGVVAEVHKRAGEWVDRGEPVARVVRVDRLRAEGYVAVDKALAGLLDRPVEVAATLADGSVLRAEGRVVFVSPEAEPVNSQVRFWAEVDNARLTLRPGLKAEVTISQATGAPSRESPR